MACAWVPPGSRDLWATRPPLSGWGVRDGPPEPVLTTAGPWDFLKNEARSAERSGHRRHTVPCIVRGVPALRAGRQLNTTGDRKSTRLNSSHVRISYAVFCLKKTKAHHVIRE